METQTVIVLLLLLLALVFGLIRAFGWGSGERPHFGWLGFVCFVAATLVSTF